MVCLQQNRNKKKLFSSLFSHECVWRDFSKRSMDAHVFDVIAAGMETACKIIICETEISFLNFNEMRKKCCKNFIHSFDL